MSDDFLKALGKRVLAKREEMRMTQDGLSEISGLSAQVISNTESGRTAIRPDNLAKLANALSVSTDYLLTGDVIDKDMLPLHQQLNKLTPDQLNDLQIVIELFVKNSLR